jgi:outer membrane receptor protein involved in Fe transport
MAKRTLTSAASLIALLAWPAMAHAQTATSATASATEDTAPESEIVVTAQGRSQVLSDVPVAISAVSAETLQNSGANDIRQLNQVAPSLLVSSTGSEANGSARIRGIGTVGDNPGLESSVAVFIDGVYRSRSGIGLNELGAIERVEVQRGPQGTLGGRNSSAGLISILSVKPRFDGFAGDAEATYGNYDYYRLAGGLNVPLGETLAGRLDGVYVKRDGFYTDPANNTDVNDRNRWFVRGQLLFEPTSDLSVRLIGDWSRRNEKCCGAVYVDRSVNPYIGDLNNLAAPLSVGGAPPTNGNNIINVLRDLGQNLNAFNQGYGRTLSVTPGRSYAGVTEDRGVSGTIEWNLGGAKLTSITAYRDYDSSQGGDIDYSTVDILYRTDASARRFKTFTQELRLQGEAFGGKLDWLVGGFFANENLTLTDDTKFGSQYGKFAACRIISGGGLAALYSPASPGCLAARPAAFGAASPLVYAGFDNLYNINNQGSTGDLYHQNSRNFALFTHNIFHLTDQLDFTAGLRWTSERKKMDATFGNNNTACANNQALLGGFINPASPSFNAALFGAANSIIALSCVGNSTSELNGVSINDKRSESELTGTAILSYKATDDLLLYGSYSRGYKAGGFNLDRSALKNPNVSFASAGGAQALVGNLQFDPEKVNAFEIGAKYATGPFTLTVAAFRQDFRNFQLNTFDGLVFIVQNINGCSASLNGADRDQSVRAGAPNFVNPSIVAGSGFSLNPAAATGACAAGDVGYGVRSQGVELEASLRPARDLMVNLGMTYAQTKYRENLVGTANGAPLSPALRKLPGDNLSNAPELVTTASLAWTPPLGNGGMSGLVYVDSRMTGDYNTGSDLFPQKEQDGYAIVNARIGIRGPDERWSIELWSQNLFNKNYAQVAFNSPIQEGSTSVPPFAPGFSAAPFVDPQYPGGRQIFSQYLAEPRTFGATARVKF